jgi:hypothetical protein
MSTNLRPLAIAVSVVGMTVASSSITQAQNNPCAEQNPRQACSYQCCGRRSCPPSCEVDCVKVCVDACSSVATRQLFSNRKHELQIRCGNKNLR